MIKHSSYLPFFLLEISLIRIELEKIGEAVNDHFENSQNLTKFPPQEYSATFAH